MSVHSYRRSESELRLSVLAFSLLVMEKLLFIRVLSDLESVLARCGCFYQSCSG